MKQSGIKNRGNLHSLFTHSCHCERSVAIYTRYLHIPVIANEVWQSQTNYLEFKGQKEVKPFLLNLYNPK